MTKTIAITGTHGTGKTTLSYLLAAHYKSLGCNVKIIQEVARSCPFPINNGMTRESALWIYHEHCRKELEAQKDHDIVICDRTSFDSFVYAYHFSLDIPISLARQARDNLLNYTKVFLVKPDSEMLEDGIRDTNKCFQEKINDLFTYELSTLMFFDCTQLKTSDIFSEEQIWKQYCL